ncbi:MAG: mannitol-1-phosphate 5-dehydrogenase [Peptostreptococcaceae bacterium]
MKKAIQFGAGNIGRGFIGLLLSKAGFEVLFADVNMEIIDGINNEGKYSVFVRDTNCEDIEVSNIRGINSLDEKLVNEISEASIITTAVGPVVLPRIAKTLAEGIKLRKENNVVENLNVIACENAIYASQILKEEVVKFLDEETVKYVEEYVGFPNCSVDRIVPPIKNENILDVTVEAFYEWNVEQAGFKGEIPQIEGMNLADNLMAYIERKLFTLNTGHAVAAYLGYIYGIDTIDKSVCDEKIRNIVKDAMIESGKGLIAKYGFEEDVHFKYIDKILKRFENPYLNDDVVRVGREPIRKLSCNDRLVKPLLNAKNYDVEVDNLVIGLAAALHYKNDKDTQSVELQNMIDKDGVESTIKEVCKIDDDVLIKQISTQYNSLKK